ncbi:hypothetical protein V8E36_008730 [Tilletia maclaganii]
MSVGMYSNAKAPSCVLSLIQWCTMSMFASIMMGAGVADELDRRLVVTVHSHRPHPSSRRRECPFEEHSFPPCRCGGHVLRLCRGKGHCAPLLRPP